MNSFKIKQQFEIGLGYKRGEIFKTQALLYTNLGIRVGYAYNYSFSDITISNGSSHEILLGIGLPFFNENNSFKRRKYLTRKGSFKR